MVVFLACVKAQMKTTQKIRQHLRLISDINRFRFWRSLILRYDHHVFFQENQRHSPCHVLCFFPIWLTFCKWAGWSHQLDAFCQFLMLQWDPSAVVVLGCGLNGYLNTEPKRVFGARALGNMFEDHVFGVMWFCGFFPCVCYFIFALAGFRFSKVHQILYRNYV